MKRIVLLLTVLTFTLSSIGQNFILRTNGTFTPVDPHLSVPWTLYIPKVCDTLVNPLHGGKDSVGALIFDTCNHKVWMRDNIGTIHRWIDISSYALIVANGINRIGDSVLLGAPLTKTTFIRENINRSDPNALNNNFLFLSNVPPDSSAYTNYFLNTTYDRSNLTLNRFYYDNDTITKQYGGTVQGATRLTLSPSNKRYIDPSFQIVLPYGGANMISQLFPPDTSYLKLSVFGQTGSAYSGDIGIGGDNAFKITLHGSPQYPMPVYRSGFDYARNSISIKREFYGSPTAGYVWDWRHYQANISAGTTDYGSYANKNVGFMAYGTIYSHDESPSKAKTLSVSTMDTSIGFWARPMWTDKNEVKNGYGFYNEGTSDYNYFAGITKLGGTMPSVSNPQTRRLHVDSTIQVGRLLATNTFFTNYWSRSAVTPANFNSSPTRGLWIQNEISFDQNVSIDNTGITAVRGQLDLYADSVQNCGSTTGVGVMGANFGLFLHKKSGYTDTTTFKGSTSPFSCAAALTSRFDVSGTAGSGSELLGTGYFASLQPNFIFSAFNKLDNAIWLNIGTAQWGGTTNAVNGYGIYINGFPSQVTNKYALYQAGTLDTVLINGKLKLNNLTAPSSTYNLLVQGSDSLTHQLSVSTLNIPSNSIVGTATNDDAIAGNLGENIESYVTTYTNYTTTATYQNIASITLTPGNWEINAFGTFYSNGATITAGNDAIFLIGTATASATGSTEGVNVAYVPQAALLGTSHESVTIPPYRVKIASTTTYYFNTQATFTLGNPQFVGGIKASRPR